MFIATVSAVAKLWNQPKHPTANEWIKQCDIYIYKGILLGHNEEQNYKICKKTGGIEDHQIE
jgi:hypothetical protein